MSSIGDRLQEARIKKGLSQIQVMEKTGINNKTLSGYEKGRNEPDLETVKILADLYEVKPNWLIGADVDNDDSSVDPELLSLLEQVKEKGMELEATALLRTAASMNKDQLKDLLKVFSYISNDNS